MNYACTAKELLLLAAVSFGSLLSLSAQVTMRNGTSGGGKEYLNILAPQSAQNIDTLFARVSAQGVELDTLFERTDSLRADADTLYARLAATSASIPDSVDWANITAPIINFTNTATDIDFDVDDITLDADVWNLQATDDITFYTSAHAQFICEDDMVIGSNDDDSYWDTELGVENGTDILDIYIVFDAENDYPADFDVITTNLDGDEMQIISEDDLLIQAGRSDGNDISIEMVSLEDAMAFKATTIYAAGKFMPTHLVLPTSIPANPVAGSIYLDGAFIKYYNGTSWEMLSVVP